jgi:hypothetical protein
VTSAEIRYTRSGDVNIAYQVVGEGPHDFVFVPAITHLELPWEDASEARFFNRLASTCRLIMLNQRVPQMSE